MHAVLAENDGHITVEIGPERRDTGAPEHREGRGLGMPVPVADTDADHGLSRLQDGEQLRRH